MGLYDYIHCEIPLPHGDNATVFQTKDTARQYMMDHTIRADGRLILHDHETESTPKAELPYAGKLAVMAPDDPGRALYELFGCMRKKAGTERDIDQNFDGDLHFYDEREYRATFRGGACQEISELVGAGWIPVWQSDEHGVDLTIRSSVGR